MKKSRGASFCVHIPVCLSLNINADKGGLCKARPEANQKNRSFLSLLQNRITPAQIDRSVLQTYVPIIG